MKLTFFAFLFIVAVGIVTADWSDALKKLAGQMTGMAPGLGADTDKALGAAGGAAGKGGGGDDGKGGGGDSGKGGSGGGGSNHEEPE